jgi:hypothetical protein
MASNSTKRLNRDKIALKSTRNKKTCDKLTEVGRNSIKSMKLKKYEQKLYKIKKIGGTEKTLLNSTKKRKL